MKITFNWLKDHLTTSFNEGKLLEQLTNVGLEVESIENLSAELDFKLCVLSGFQTSRAASLELFKAEGRRAVLFASAMTDCSGIDLPNTTDIILWHKLPPATEQQVIGRSRRVSTSSSHQTTIHHLYREN